eukprot:g2392.t1
MGDYTKEIHFGGKRLVIWGNNATLDARKKGRFFSSDNDEDDGGHAGGKTSLLELHDLVMQNGEADSGWTYVTHLLVDSSALIQNNAGTADGGALALRNVNATASGCNISNNSAAASGGAVALLPGTAQLIVNGTMLADNLVSKKLGTVLHSASEGGIHFVGNTHVELAAASGGSTGLFVVQAGKVEFGGKSTFLCPPGERFVNNVTQGPGVFDDWQINCSELVAVAVQNTSDDTVVGTYRAFAQP